MAQKACKITIEGRVQGVGFRFFTQDKAREHGIKGYVKNMYDGSVEVHAEGNEDNLNAFVNDLKSGPPMAHVENTNIRWLEPENRYESFTIEY